MMTYPSQLKEKIAFSLILSVICLLPFWLYLLIKLIFAPEGFWQNIFLVGIGVYFLGAIQLALLAILAALLFAIWKKD